MSDSATPPGVDEPKDTSKGRLDWEAIERDYRAGVLSTREIAEAYGCSHTIINRKAKENGWVKDLTSKIKKRVSTALVALEVSTAHAGGNTDAGNTHQTKKEAEAETVEAAAQTVVGVIVSHRKDVNRARGLVAMLMNQLHEAADHRESIRDIIEDETQGDRSPNRRMAMLRAVAIPAHAGTVRDLSMAMKNLVALERQAFNIDLNPPDEAPPVNGSEEGVAVVTDAALDSIFLKMSEITGNPINDAPANDPEAEPKAQSGT